jgi:hypothetical protein
MKRKLFPIASILILILLTQNLLAQTTPSATPQTTPTKTKAVQTKRWRRPAVTAPATARPITARPAAVKVDTAKNTDFSLNGQYQFLLSKSRSVNGYKLINPFRLSTVWKSAQDTLRKERAELKKLRATAAAQAQSISVLRGEVKSNELEVNATNAKVDEINFLGISFTKSSFTLMMWSIVGVLAAALAIVIARSGKSILEAKHRTQLYEELSTEYQAFKVKANEKERKLARELQDERNKLDELTGRG